MDSREALIQATLALMEEAGDELERITVRDICKRAGVGLGLVNYHFGNKDKLLAECVERVINGVVERFRALEEDAGGQDPRETLERLGNLTLDYLFQHPAAATRSILTDMVSPKEQDNTHRTFEAYLPLVAACRPDWDQETVRRKTFCLITEMQQAFLRREVTSRMLGIDLNQAPARRAFHAQVLRDLLEG